MVFLCPEITSRGDTMQPKTIIDTYYEVLSGERKYFPMYTWDHKGSKDQLIKLARHILLDKLQMDRAAVIEQVCLAFLTEHKIGSAVRRIYQKDTCMLVIDCFPEWDIKPWELKTGVPQAYWTEDNVIIATKWLVEDVLRWDLDRVQNEISDSYFRKYKLWGMLRTVKMGAIDAVVLSYPEHDWTYLKERRGYKITDKQAIEIKQSYQDGINMYILANTYKVSVTSIFQIVHNQTFKIAPHEL